VNDFFKDLFVVELAGVLAGPSAGLFFAELGARVMKIENPKTGGDVTRSWKLSSEDPRSDTSAYYWSVNARKETRFMNLAEDADLQALYNLVRSADIVITNYKAGDDVKLKVDAKTLRALNPRLIYASINGFGKDSPRTAYDLILQAESGFMFMNGEKDARPVKMPVALIDLLAGHQLKEGILLALLHRAKSGQGSTLSVSLFDSAVASLANQATNWLIAHQLPQAQGSLHPNIAPYGELFTTADDQLVTFAIGSNKQFAGLCHIIGLEQLPNQAAYADNQQRVLHREPLYGLMKEAIARLTFEALYKACLDKDIPIGKIRNLAETFALPETQSLLHAFVYRQQPLQSVNSVAFRFEKESAT